MRISMKSEYGLRAMMELAGYYGRGPLQTAEIAARRSIPVSYLEQLLTALRRAGLVASVRGPQGGHSLARQPADVTAGDVVRALDGPVVVIECGSNADGIYGADGDSVLQELWGSVRLAVDEALDGVTVEDLVNRQRARQGGLMYNI